MDKDYLLAQSAPNDRVTFGEFHWQLLILAFTDSYRRLHSPY